MDQLKNKQWWKAAGTRAIKTMAQTAAAMLPVGITITPTMIQQLDMSTGYVVLAWLGTVALAGVGSLITSLAGLPEVD